MTERDDVTILGQLVLDALELNGANTRQQVAVRGLLKGALASAYAEGHAYGLDEAAVMIKDTPGTGCGDWPAHFTRAAEMMRKIAEKLRPRMEPLA